jgi:hypothetical protein
MARPAQIRPRDLDEYGMASEIAWTRRVDCPSDEALAAWCERKLAGGEKLRIDLHLIDCDYCREIAIRVCQGLEAREMESDGRHDN